VEVLRCSAGQAKLCGFCGSFRRVSSPRWRSK
jgi:hypothetical protein